MKVSSSLLGRDGRDIWDRVFLQRGEKWAKFGDMLILDSPLVCWTGLINAAPRHRELAEAGQEQSSCFLRRPSTKFSVVQWPRHKHLVGSTPENYPQRESWGRSDRPVGSPGREAGDFLMFGFLSESLKRSSNHKSINQSITHHLCSAEFRHADILFQWNQTKKSVLCFCPAGIFFFTFIISYSLWVHNGLVYSNSISDT